MRLPFLKMFWYSLCRSVGWVGLYGGATAVLAGSPAVAAALPSPAAVARHEAAAARQAAATRRVSGMVLVRCGWLCCVLAIATVGVRLG